jgi:hypothetical protein
VLINYDLARQRQQDMLAQAARRRLVAEARKRRPEPAEEDVPVTDEAIALLDAEVAAETVSAEPS